LDLLRRSLACIAAAFMGFLGLEKLDWLGVLRIIEGFWKMCCIYTNTCR
jgi:hypothetical protein